MNSKILFWGPGRARSGQARLIAAGNKWAAVVIDLDFLPSQTERKIPNWKEEEEEKNEFFYFLTFPGASGKASVLLVGAGNLVGCSPEQLEAVRSKSKSKSKSLIIFTLTWSRQLKVWLTWRQTFNLQPRPTSEIYPRFLLANTKDRQSFVQKMEQTSLISSLIVWFDFNEAQRCDD